MGKAQRHDVEMEEAVLKGLVEASKQIQGGKLNPIKRQYGEIIPSNLERSFSGFLVTKDAIKFKVNTKMLLACIAL